MQIVRSDIYENVKMALSILKNNKLRSLLTMSGVLIGVWTVMAIASIISGIDKAVEREVESFGTRSIFLYKFDIRLRAAKPTREERMRKGFTYEDAIAIGKLPSIELSVPNLVIFNSYFGQRTNVSAGGKTSANVRIEGTLPSFEGANIWTLAEGRFFTQYENDTHREVCAISADVAENFFPQISAVDQTLKIGGHDFRVLGVFEKREQFFLGGDGADQMNNSIFIPFAVAQKLRPGADDIYIVAVARPGEMDEARSEISDLLRIRRQIHRGDPDNYGVATADSFIEQFRSISYATEMVMICVSSIGLVIGGIGVMNIMLLAVTERTLEIGLRKAIGARRRDILWQFLIEAMTLTGLGGVGGLGIGWATTFALRHFVPSYVPAWAPIAGFVASVGTGLIFGLWPAWKAAHLDPIAALHYQ